MDSVDPQPTSPTSFKKMDREISNSNKLYIGNLPPQASEILLRNFISHHSGGVSSITVKQGYGFIECIDQTSADIIIDAYQGRCFLGNPLAVEPAVRGPRTNFKRIPRILLSQYPQRMIPETSYLFIPSKFVGAIIGNKGLTIRNMIRESGASMKIENIMTDAPADYITDRRISIYGTIEAHWRAQYLIFQKLTEDGRLPYDINLTLEILVPAEMIGKLIGRGGARIKEIQADTGATVRFLIEGGMGKGKTHTHKDVPTQMSGRFHSLYNAQLKIRQILLANATTALHNRRRNFIPRATDAQVTQVNGQSRRERARRQYGSEELKAINPLTEKNNSPTNANSTKDSTSQAALIDEIQSP